MSQERIIQILLMIPVMLISLSVHEFAHARVAYARGDATARNLGRMTVNPLKHIDPIGALCMILFRFGWAKPVPVNSRNLRNPQRDMALVSIAGPISNLLLAFLGALFLTLCEQLMIKNGILFIFNHKYFLVDDSFSSNALWMLRCFFELFHVANITLAIFNLIPIPPLDGSRILTMFLPPRYYWKLQQYEPYFGIILMLLVLLGSFTGIISFVTSFISNGMLNICSHIPFLS